MRARAWGRSIACYCHIKLPNYQKTKKQQQKTHHVVTMLKAIIKFTPVWPIAALKVLLHNYKCHFQMLCCHGEIKKYQTQDSFLWVVSTTRMCNNSDHTCRQHWPNFSPFFCSLLYFSLSIPALFSSASHNVRCNWKLSLPLFCQSCVTSLLTLATCLPSLVVMYNECMCRQAGRQAMKWLDGFLQPYDYFIFSVNNSQLLGCN